MFDSQWNQFAMKLFRSVISFYHSMGIDPLQPNQNPFNWKNLLILSNLAISSILVAGFFVLKAQTLREYGDSFYSTLALFVSGTSTLDRVLNNELALKLIENFEGFIRRRSHKLHARVIYNNLNENIEKVSKILRFLLTKMTVPGIILPFCIMSVLDYSISDSKEEAFVLPYPTMWPFNKRRPFGYASAVLCETAATYCLCLATSAAMGFLIGSCWSLVIFADDLSNDLKLFIGVKKPSEYRKIFYEILDSYIDARQYVRDLCDIYQFTVTIIFLWTLSTIGSSLVVLQTEISNGFIEIIPTLVMAFWSFGMISFFCEIGERVTTAFEEFDHELRTCNWYLFPIDLQRTLPTVMMYSQKPATIHGYGNTPCTRFALNTTVKGGFSFFMALQQMAK